MTFSIDFQLVLALGLMAVVLGVLLSPLESLAWWAGWFHDRTAKDQLDTDMDGSTVPDSIKGFVVYLTGIGGYSEHAFLPREAHFLEELDNVVDDLVVIKDIYPYSVTNNGLIDNRLLARFWRFTVHLKESKSPFGFLINIRNLLQVLVAADNRYGPIYAHGMAQVLLDALNRHGYPAHSGLPVFIIGYSGGGEMSISGAGPLKQVIAAPVVVISLGGVISNDPNVMVVDHLYHLYGEKDRVHLLGYAFPGRWPIAHYSMWNQALREGRITKVPMGPMAHNGPGGYLDTETSMSDGTPYLKQTINTMCGIFQSFSANEAPEQVAS